MIIRRTSFATAIGKAALLCGLLVLGPATSHADVDCTSIAACTVPHNEINPSYSQPAFQASITGTYHVEMDLFSDVDCTAFIDTATADGTGSGLTTFEYGLPLSSGDVVFVKVRAGSCDETACLQITGGENICQGF